MWKTKNKIKSSLISTLFPEGTKVIIETLYPSFLMSTRISYITSDCNIFRLLRKVPKDTKMDLRTMQYVCNSGPELLNRETQIYSNPLNINWI